MGNDSIIEVLLIGSGDGRIINGDVNTDGNSLDSETKTINHFFCLDIEKGHLLCWLSMDQKIIP